MNNAKNVLKSLVKECLVELLQEGIGSSGYLRESKSKVSRPKETNNGSRNFTSSVTRSPIVEEKNKIKENNLVNKNIDNIITSIADNDLMRSILSDTANTTLVEQLKHDRANYSSETHRDIPSAEGPGIDIDSIFSENKNNWNLMAFGKSKK